MANNCQVPTPPQYVEELLDYIGYTNDLYDKSVLENSCGEGNILKGIVKRYIISAIKEGYSTEQIVFGLENYITGYDIDPVCIEKCIKGLNELAKTYGLEDVRWNVQKRDYLELETNKYHYIIGNPPYITYHDLSIAQRKFVKEKYETCKEGRFDYCYAFIEAGLRDLTSNGKLAYIIPYSVIRNKYANKIRKMIKNQLVGIIDYKGIQLFPNTLTSSIIILCDNQYKNSIYYYNKNENSQKNIEKSNLGDKWFFEESQIGQRRFGDYFKVSNSIATLYNNAFVFEAKLEDEKFYYLKDGKIEKEVVFDAVSSKSEKKYLKSQKRDKIIFPYKRKNGRVTSYQEEEFKNAYPECYAFLQDKKENLLERKSSEGVNWFEYGRVQAINNVFVDKLVMSVVITNNVNVYKVGRETVPYAGIFITALRGDELSLENAAEILQSNSFYTYVKKCGTPTTTSSYRISVKDIENYCF